MCTALQVAPLNNKTPAVATDRLLCVPPCVCTAFCVHRLACGRLNNKTPAVATGRLLCVPPCVCTAFPPHTPPYLLDPPPTSPPYPPLPLPPPPYLPPPYLPPLPPLSPPTPPYPPPTPPLPPPTPPYPPYPPPYPPQPPPYPPPYLQGRGGATSCDIWGNYRYFKVDVETKERPRKNTVFLKRDSGGHHSTRGE